MKGRLNTLRYAGIVTVVVLLAATQSAPRAPSQPTSGPGGTDYPHSGVSIGEHGTGDTQYWLYTPKGPVPDSAPVIVFLHGWGGMNPGVYGAWIKHLVRRGNIVIYPRYQESLRTSPALMTESAEQAIRRAFWQLASVGPVKPQRDRFALVGHSLGGTIAANIASEAQKVGLPQVRALMVVEPGDSKNSEIAQRLGARIPSILGDYSKTPRGTLLLCVVGEEDRAAGDVVARHIFDSATAVAERDKGFVIVRSDYHGEPALIANHFAPLAPDRDFDSGEAALRERFRERAFQRARPWMERAQQMVEEAEELAPLLRGGGVDALDYFGFWKLFDGLTDAAFYGTHRDCALGGGKEMRHMGRWSDAVPVAELAVEQAAVRTGNPSEASGALQPHPTTNRQQLVVDGEPEVVITVIGDRGVTIDECQEPLTLGSVV